MLPAPANRSSGSNKVSAKSHTILLNDDNDDSPRPSQKFPTSDFSTHFVIKGSSSSPSSEQVSLNTNGNSSDGKKFSPIPVSSITVTKCPDIPTPSNNISNNANLTPPQNQPSAVTVTGRLPRPLTSTSTSYMEFLPSPSTIHVSQAEAASSSPSSASATPTVPSSPSSYTFAARRSNSLLHPFMNAHQKSSTTLLPGRMLSTPSPRTSLLSFPDSPMDFCYQSVSPFCLRKNKMGEYENDEEETCCGTQLTSNNKKDDGDYEEILKACGQRSPIPIDMIFNGIKDIEKIGEGVYGEVYSGSFRYFSQCSWVYKVVAIAGDTMVNGEKQKGFSEVLPEIVVSQELSKLKGVLNKCYTDGYAFMKNARIAKGRYPVNLIQPWETFHEKYESDNDKPEFGPEQLYMVLEFEFAGQDIESLNFRDARQTLSIVLQVAHILAVGEFALEFEHRDLHWGNILVQNWGASTVRYLINGETFHVPSIGIKAAVIDFTISRVKHSKTQVPIFLDLQDDEEQFLGTGDHQFDIYRMMRDHNRNKWELFRPKSNIFWLHYLANKLYVKGQYTITSVSSGGNRARSAHHLRAVRKLRELSHTILEHESAKDFVLSRECRAYREFLGSPTPLSSACTSAEKTPPSSP